MYIFGASGHGKVIASILLDQKINIKAFIDDNPSSDSILNVPVYKTNYVKSKSIKYLIIGIGDNSIRRRISKLYNVNFARLFHSSSIICKTVKVLEGTVVMANAIINVDSKIGKHCIINSGSIVEHDCVVEDFVHISPNATLSGGVTVGEGTHIGAGAIIIPGIKVGKWAVIGAGSVIIEDIPDGSVVVGVPGKIIKTKDIKDF